MKKTNEYVWGFASVHPNRIYTSMLLGMSESQPRRLLWPRDSFIIIEQKLCPHVIPMEWNVCLLDAYRCELCVAFGEQEHTHANIVYRQWVSYLFSTVGILRHHQVLWGCRVWRYRKYYPIYPTSSQTTDFQLIWCWWVDTRQAGWILLEWTTQAEWNVVVDIAVVAQFPIDRQNVPRHFRSD